MSLLSSQLETLEVDGREVQNNLKGCIDNKSDYDNEYEEFVNWLEHATQQAQDHGNKFELEMDTQHQTRIEVVENLFLYRIF